MRTNPDPRFPFLCTLREYLEKGYKDGYIKLSEESPRYIRIAKVGHSYTIKIRDGWLSHMKPSHKVYLRWKVIQISNTRLRKILKGWKIVVNIVGQGTITAYTLCAPEAIAFMERTGQRKEEARNWLTQWALKENNIKFNKIKFIEHEK